MAETEDGNFAVAETPDGGYSRAAWRALSQSVVYSSFLYKIPQMRLIVCTGSAAGISLSSVVLELLAYTIILANQVSKGHPAHTYHEQNFSVLQDFVLMILIMKRRYMIKAGILPIYALYVTFFLSMCFNKLPIHAMTILVSCTSPMLIWSKVNQLMTIWRTKTSGSMSSLTWFFACYNTAARILVTSTVTKDLPALMYLVASEVLNMSILLSLCYYTAKQAEQTTRRPRMRPLSR